MEGEAIPEIGEKREESGLFWGGEGDELSFRHVEFEVPLSRPHVSK